MRSTGNCGLNEPTISADVAGSRSKDAHTAAALDSKFEGSFTSGASCWNNRPKVSPSTCFLGGPSAGVEESSLSLGWTFTDLNGCWYGLWRLGYVRLVITHAARRNQGYVRVTTRVPRPDNQPPILFYAVPSKREYTSAKGLYRRATSYSKRKMGVSSGLTSDASLELVYPPDDGRYTGSGSVYFETDMEYQCRSVPVRILYRAREPPSVHTKTTVKTQRDASDQRTESAIPIIFSSPPASNHPRSPWIHLFSFEDGYINIFRIKHTASPPPSALFSDISLPPRSSGCRQRHASCSQKTNWTDGMLFAILLSGSLGLTVKKSRDIVEAYHYQPLGHRKKVVRLNALVPDDETLSNPRYINVEEHFNVPRRSAKVHDCRVIIGADMYLVTGYWYRHGDVNRSIKTATGLTWKGELIVVKAGRSIPYLKRVSHSRKADIAASKYVIRRLPAFHPRPVPC